MNELRWILLVAGLLLVAGIYAWGVRTRRRAAAPEHERVTRVEPARTVAVVPESDDDDEPRDDEAPIDAYGSRDEDDLEAEPALRPEHGRPRREPRLEPRIDASLDEEIEPPTIRLEPRIESRAAPRAEPRPEPRVEPRVEAAVDDRRASPAKEPERKPTAQKIVAVRVVAAAGAHFAGTRLLDALTADGFTFGRYQIFHRLDDAGRPLVSLASLKEPGTFDPEAMPGAQFRGIALFTVMPGPLAGVRAFDELIVTARALAATLGGQLQDERGSPLSLARIGHLREEVAEFERARGAAPDR
jgi:cell division protein ZipA